MEQTKTNILFIFADDLGYGDLGCYGNHEIKTPNIDALAQEGRCYMQFYVASPVCSPSRASVLTGQYPARHKIHGHFSSYIDNENREMPNWLSVDAVTIGKLLKEQGYLTAHYGKWHLGGGGSIYGHPDAPAPAEYGFDDTRVWTGNGPTWNGLKRWPFPVDNMANDIFSPNKTGDEFLTHSDMLAANETIKFMERAKNADKPFFINLWLRTPHTPLRATEEQREPYLHIPEPRQTYYSAVTEADKQVGRVLEQLEALGLAEDTIVIFSSDNGPECVKGSYETQFCQGSTGGLRGTKRSLYEGGTRVPFVVRWPGHVEGLSYDYESLISGVDLLPTFCNIAGATLPEDYVPDGLDITEALLGKSFDRPIPLMWEWISANRDAASTECPAHAIREGKYVLLKNPDNIRVELYDLERDERQLVNIAKEHPTVVEKLSAKMDEWTQALPFASARTI